MIRLIIVDDSPTVRAIFKMVMSKAGDIEVVGEAQDPYEARDQIARLRPDVITLDMEMPRMDGLTFLQKLKEHYPLPVVVCSSLTARGSELAMAALDAGAAVVLRKPAGLSAMEQLREELVSAIRQAASWKSKPRATETSVLPRLAVQTNRVLAIGASTGGTVAIEELLKRMPDNLPPTLITQHMPPGFTRAFAERLTRLCKVKVVEASGTEELPAGTVAVAPGGKHLMLRSSGTRYYAEVREGPKVNGHCPAVDVLFRSVAQMAGGRAVGVLLTGMGRDGAKGLLEMREAGAATFAQDEASSVVYGMPAAAVEIGAAQESVPLSQMAARILREFESNPLHAPIGGAVPARTP